MSRKFTTVDYEATLDQAVSLRGAGRQSSGPVYRRSGGPTRFEPDRRRLCGSRGGIAYAPEILLALLFYGYAPTGVFSARKIHPLSVLG